MIDRWRTIVPERTRIVMWGAGDQGRVNRYILESLGCEIAALIDDTPDIKSPLPAVPLLRGRIELESWLKAEKISSLGFVVAIGNPFGHVRCRLHDLMSGLGLHAISFAERTSLLCKSAELGEGLQVMAHAIVHNEARLARQCLINTRALVEHDCHLEEGVEIGPGATLCGRVYVGANTWVGAGATVRPRVRIGSNTIIGAGAVVVSDIPDGVVAVGVPARPVRKNEIDMSASAASVARLIR